MALNYLISVTGDCSNSSLGSANLIFYGSTPPYTANWISPNLGVDTAVTATTRTTLSAGTYVLQVNDSTLPVNESIYINVEISSGVCVSTEIIDTTCAQNNGQISVSATTNASYTEYSLISGNTLISSGVTNVGYQIFTNLTAGTYQVLVKDIGGCTGSTGTLIIHDSNNIEYGLYVIGDTSCFGPTGKIFVTGCTGPGPYTFLWSNGETTQNITGLTAGIYSVTVSNNEGCSVTQSGIVQTIPPPDVVLITAISPTCFESNGEVTIFVTGGTEPFYYSGSNGYSIISYSREFTLTGLTSGNYSISVTDCSLCNVIADASVQAVNTFNVISVNTQNSYCGNKDGSIEVNVQGGSPLYTYTLIDLSGNTLNWSTNSTQYTFNNLDYGEYTLFVKDNSGCIYTDTLYILTENKFSVSATTTGTTCGNNNGSVNITLSSGGTAPYQYLLSNGSFLNNSSLTSITFNNLIVGQYVATVTDATNCIQTIPFYIGIDSGPLFFTLNGNLPAFPQTGGTIDALITSGNPPFTLDWSDNVNGQNSLTITGLTAGTYSLNIVDSNGCTLTRTLDLEITTPFKGYQVFNMCSSPFTINTNTKTGILQMTWDGFSSICNDDFGCILNETKYTTIIKVSGNTYQNSFYTGTTLNDVPTDDQWRNSVAYLLNQIPGVGTFNINLSNNSITIQTECDENLLGGESLDIDLKIDYDISCEATPTPSATATPTPTPSSSPTPSASPTPSPTPSATATLTATPTSTGPTATPTSSATPTPSPTPSATQTASPTPSPSPTSTLPICLTYVVYSFGGGTWSGTLCSGGQTSGPVPNNSTIYTDCIVEGTLLLNNAIVITTTSCTEPTPTPYPTPTSTVSCTNVTGLSVLGTSILGEATLYGTIFFGSNLTQDTTVNLTVITSNYGTQTIGFTVPTGNSSYNFENSLGVLGVSPIITSFCISSVDNYGILCTDYQCDSSACLCGVPTPTPGPTSTLPPPTPTTSLCTAYEVQPAGSMSVEWFDCNGGYFTATYFSQATICAETGTIVQTGGYGSIMELYSCTS